MVTLTTCEYGQLYHRTKIVQKCHSNNVHDNRIAELHHCRCEL